MPTDSAGDDDDFLEQWADPEKLIEEAEQPFGDPEQSIADPQPPAVTDSEDGFDSDQLTRDLSEVDSDLLNTFAVCVLLTNVGVLLVTVGILFGIASGHVELGVGLVLAGLVALLRVAHHYRSYKQSRADDTADPTEQND